MSSIGFPDGQRITQWLGAPIVQGAALAIGNVLHTDGPFSLASWASVIVAVKPTGGTVTVTVKQQISGGPPGLELDTTFVVPAGGTAFEAVVLFGDAVTLTMLGSAPGVTVDYAIYPSNSTTNAQVLTQATISVQHNDVLVAAEPTLDLEDALGFTWGVVDDAANTRLKITPPSPAVVTIADALLGVAAASIDFPSIPQTYRHLFFESSWRSSTAATNDRLILRANADAGANYAEQALRFSNAVSTDDKGVAETSFQQVFLPAATAPAGAAGNAEGKFPDYASTTLRKTLRLDHGFSISDAATNDFVSMLFGTWRSLAAINRLTFSLSSGANFVAGSRVTLYGRI